MTVLTEENFYMRHSESERSEMIVKYDSSPMIENSLGRLLVEAGILKQSEIASIVECQKTRNLRFGEAAIYLGLVKEVDITRMLASQFEYSYLQPGVGGFSAELFAAYQPYSKQVEAFRHLRTKIKLIGNENPLKTIALISINPGDGCSYTTANLATVFSQLGEKTLLIDANLRNPRQHTLFNLSQRQGLADLLAGKCGIETVKKIPELKNLSVLPVGTLPPNPQELLSKPIFEALLKEFEQTYDIILIDSGAAAHYADCQLVCTKAKNMLLVCKKNKTRAKEFQAIKNQLTDFNVKCIGAILNEI